MKCTSQHLKFIIQGQQNNAIDQSSVILVDSTCLPHQIMNSNNAIDSSNLLYVTGSFIVQQNIFQNMKTFIQRISDGQVMGMAHNQIGESHFALASKERSNNTKDTCIHIEYYIPSTKEAKLYTIEGADRIIDFKFLDSKKIILIFAYKMEYFIGILNLSEKVSKIAITLLKNQPEKLIINQHKAYTICKKGLLQYDELCEDISAQLILPQIKIVDFKVVDNQIQLILCQEYLQVRQSFQLLQRESLTQYFDDEQKASCLAKIGRNILISYRTSINISHFILEEQKLRFVNNYTYKQKIKGGVARIVQSFDEMHLLMTVFTKEKDQEKLQNFMFNLSILSSNKKFINPFMRASPLGIEPGDPSCFQNAVISISYYLSGPYIIGYDYLESIQKKQKFLLHDNPKCFAVHPMAYQFCCIYETFIKFYSKIQNQLIDIWTEQIICCAAAYSFTGLLALAFLEDNRYEIMIYDSYNYRKIRNIGSFYCKQSINRIQWCHNSTCLAIYCQNQFYVYRLTGEKRIQFKEKCLCSYIQYQQIKEDLIVCTQYQQINIYKKSNTNDTNIQLIKTANINQTVTCVKVNSNLGLLFMSTQSGKLLWTDYPFESSLDSENIKWNKLNLHNNPISNLLISNNLKYIFVSVKNRGLFVGRIKKNFKNENTYMIFQDLQVSNLNFLQMSSKQCLQNGKQKLKILLEKRKTSFNQLQELKKQWDLRKKFRINILEAQNQKQQLKEITQTLNKLEDLKINQKKMKQQLLYLQEEQEKCLEQHQDKYETDILFQYQKNDQLKKLKQQTICKCEKDYQKILKKCGQNLQSIENQLQTKYQRFLENYYNMRENLIKQQKRLKFEQEEQKQQQKILVQLKTKELEGKDYELQKDNNELKSQLARSKKQIDRYSHRREFLQTKIRFFGEELSYCQEQKDCLEGIKQKLEEQLLDLQAATHKKEKRLRKYFKENDLLTKFKHVHEHLKITTNKQVDFLQEQISKVMKNIIQTQKELSEVAELNQKSQAIVKSKNQSILQLKQTYKNKSYRFRYLKLMHSEIILALQNLPSGLSEEKKARELSKIYQKFYVDKKLEVFITATSQKQEEVMETKNFMNQFQKRNQQKIHTNLQLHKQYLEQNLALLDKHSEKKSQEMNLCYLKYQAQNYNLIAQCNIRKQQTAKKKRLLHQLIDSIKERQLVLNDFYKEDKSLIQKPKVQITGEIPYVTYQKKLEQQQTVHKASTLKNPSATSIKVGNSIYKVRKLLQVQKSRINEQNKPERRIKTALIKKRQTLPREEDDDIGIETEEMISKPMTANLNKRNQSKFQVNYLRQKSNSKPTTATLSSKIKLSLMH